MLTSSGPWRGVMKMHGGHCPSPCSCQPIRDDQARGITLLLSAATGGNISSRSLPLVSKYRFCPFLGRKNDSRCFSDLRPVASDPSTSKTRSRQWTQGRELENGHRTAFSASALSAWLSLWSACLISLLVIVWVYLLGAEGN